MNKRSAKRIGYAMRLWLSLVMLIIVSGCGMLTQETSQNSCCLHLKPIYMSSKDTYETQQQIIDYLVIYEALGCGS